jgi:hypothetical protein
MLFEKVAFLFGFVPKEFRQIAYTRLLVCRVADYIRGSWFLSCLLREGFCELIYSARPKTLTGFCWFGNRGAASLAVKSGFVG